MDDPAVRPEAAAARAPLREVPQVDRISAGSLDEVTGYRVIREHGTTDHLLIVTRSGQGRLLTATGAVTVAGGDVITYEPGTPHDYGVDPTVGAWGIAFAHVHPRPDWGPLLDWPEAAPGLRHLSLGGELARTVTDQLLTMARWARSGHPRSALLAMNALELALVWCDSANPRSHQLDPRIARVLTHLDTTVTQAHSIGALARLAHLSPSRFSHLFTEQVGMAPMAYLEHQRMSLARMYLELTDHPVAEVARLVGFSDPLHFSTRFRRAVGTSPRAHRRAHR
ncbi:MAG TPA: helix-turn-helix domain-containing protein [Candidatus Avipropionibacterium avicola]|uniref:Helix-turn-helix domain-containing protein n=1 Tax=Candidatus Avipropionibacterium avicola TaxID=2840701 RepID=A0A9D1GVW9_9ACTN|nr:helix-turn-helix domain-containing protein [Candidatus Avipropionibacterium avicola]